jgi:solute carrier family 25 protein 39/40
MGTWQGLRHIQRTEGVLALYRGFLPTLVMAVPATVVYFVGYDVLKETLKAPMLAGGAARILAVAAISPLELVKTRMQHQGLQGGSLQNVARDLQHLVGTQGLRVLWRGLVPTLYRDVPFSMVYWSLLERLRPRLRRLLSLSTSSLDTSATTPSDTGVIGEFAASFIGGTVAGGLAAALTVPFDVAKTRRQVNLRQPPSYSSASGNGGSVWQSLMMIARTEGWQGLTAGIIPRVVKVAPACAIMISSYELGKRLFAG